MKAHLIALLGIGLTFAGCSDAEDVITSAPECTDVCDRFQDCFDDDFDVVGCAQDCTDAAIDDEEFQDRVEECNACVDRTCDAEEFTCTAVCAGIVP